MEFFNKIEIDTRLRKAIDDGLAIGIANVNKTGKSSVEILHKDLMIKSYKNGNTLKISIDDIDFVSYSRGNIIEGDKIHIGISGNQLTITSTNNETELKNFYNNLIKVRNNEKMGVNYLEYNHNGSSTEFSKNISSILDKRINKQIPVQSTENKAKKTSNKKVIGKIDPTEEIRKYYNLLEDGIISKEEFEKKKKELLNYKYY
ncbi:MAG TPA: hypothetical protein HA355_01490 [Methanosphaera sp.]|nr:hypothetical protein [Methanosphaera sp.]